MKEQDSNIRDLFQKSLEQHQVPVDPALWSNIQAGIGASSGAAASGAASTSFFGTMLGKIAAVVIIAALGTSIYFMLPNEEVVENEPSLIEEKVAEPIQKEVLNAVVENDNEIKTEGKMDSQIPQREVQDNPIEILNPITKADIQEEYEEETLIEFVAEENDNSQTTESQKQYSMIRGDNEENRTEPDSHSTETTEVIEENFSAIFTYQSEKGNPMKFNFNPEYIDGAEYYWNFGNTDESSTISPSYEYYDEGEYEISLTVISNGHIRFSGITITVYEPSQMFIPNVITPNNDNKNDYFDLEIRSKNVSVQRLQVYDLGGKLMFESSDSIKRWNGYDRNGNLSPKGNYAFSFEAIGLDGRTYRDSGILRVN